MKKSNYIVSVANKVLVCWVMLALVVSGCQIMELPDVAALPDQTGQPTTAPSPLPEVTLPAQRPQYGPGELVDYIAQSGDNLPALAAHFNTTIDEIRGANPIIPADATTLPPGMPMQIPIYYRPLWGSSFKIIPDSAFVNGPDTVGFDTAAFVAQQDGWLKNETDFTTGRNLTGGEIVQQVADNYSINPKLLLALLEYETGALSNPDRPDVTSGNLFGFGDRQRTRLILQLNQLANILNNSYYGWREGSLVSFTHRSDGRLEYGDPWLNAGTVALHHTFAQTMPYDQYRVAISDQGLYRVYTELFGEPFENAIDIIPGSLQQPAFQLPFEGQIPWTYTGGPHAAWGDGQPWAAIDFAPPGISGCSPSGDWITAVADGVVARVDTGLVVLDLDGDGDERTGWVLLYMHVASHNRVRLGQEVKRGTAIGHPSCEGGTSTGTHVHIARKYNGEWILASGPLAFNLEGWVVESGSEAYLGRMVRYSEVVIATDFSGAQSRIVSAGLAE